MVSPQHRMLDPPPKAKCHTSARVSGAIWLRSVHCKFFLENFFALFPPSTPDYEPYYNPKITSEDVVPPPHSDPPPPVDTRPCRSRPSPRAEEMPPWS